MLYQKLKKFLCYSFFFSNFTELDENIRSQFCFTSTKISYIFCTYEFQAPFFPMEKLPFGFFSVWCGTPFYPGEKRMKPINTFYTFRWIAQISTENRYFWWKKCVYRSKNMGWKNEISDSFDQAYLWPVPMG